MEQHSTVITEIEKSKSALAAEAQHQGSGSASGDTNARKPELGLTVEVTDAAPGGAAGAGETPRTISQSQITPSSANATNSSSMGVVAAATTPSGSAPQKTGGLLPSPAAAATAPIQRTAAPPGSDSIRFQQQHQQFVQQHHNPVSHHHQFPHHHIAPPPPPPPPQYPAQPILAPPQYQTAAMPLPPPPRYQEPTAVAVVPAPSILGLPQIQLSDISPALDSNRKQQQQQTFFLGGESTLSSVGAGQHTQQQQQPVLVVVKNPTTGQDETFMIMPEVPAAPAPAQITQPTEAAEGGSYKLLVRREKKLLFEEVCKAADQVFLQPGGLLQSCIVVQCPEELLRRSDVVEVLENFTKAASERMGGDIRKVPLAGVKPEVPGQTSWVVLTESIPSQAREDAIRTGRLAPPQQNQIMFV